MLKALYPVGGQDFLEILYQVAERGYHIEWRVYNSKNYGVPQNRERVYLVGHHGGKPRHEILPKARDGGKGIKKLDGLDNNDCFQSYRVFETDGVSCTLSSANGGLGVNTGLYGQDIPKNKHREKIPQGYRVYEVDGITPTVNCAGGGVGGKTGLYGIDVINRGDITHQRSRVYNPIGHIGALTATDYKEPPKVFKPIEIDETMYPNVCKLKNNRVITVRKLTPRECFRLQGFTDEQFDRIPAEISDTQRYRQAGNSVTVPLVKEIGESIVKYWKGMDK